MAADQRLKISIVVPSFNQAEFLGRTLDSIFGQEYPPHEVIVADGASTDGSVELLQEYALRYSALQWLSEPDEGPADAVNKGLARVTGDVVGIQSSDDVYYPGAFARVIDTFTKHPECGFIYGDVESIDAHDNVLHQRRLPDFSWSALFGVSMCIPQSSIFFRRDVALDAGGWNGEIYGCDLDYWMRLMFRTKPMHVPCILSAWRRYEGQRTRPEVNSRIWRDYARMIDESPEIASASNRVQRWARASKHLMALRFPPVDSFWVILWHLLLGSMQHPTFWRYNPRGILLGWLPGFHYVRRVFRPLRRWLGKQPPPARKAPVLRREKRIS